MKVKILSLNEKKKKSLRDSWKLLQRTKLQFVWAVSRTEIVVLQFH